MNEARVRAVLLPHSREKCDHIVLHDLLKFIDPLEIENALVLDAGAVQYWVAWDWLRQAGFTFERGLVKLTCLSENLCPSGKVAPEANLSFQDPPFSLAIPISQMKSYTPKSPKEATSLESTRTLTIVGRDGKTQQIPLEEVQFARFPAEVWPGFSESWPYHWYLDPALKITSPDGKVEAINLARLARLEFPQPCLLFFAVISDIFHTPW